jgi:hypothetical protein
MESATLTALSHHQAVIEAQNPVPIHSNLLLRLEEVPGQEGEPELYAKVLRPFDESGNGHVVHFTSVPPGVRARLNQLVAQSTAS